MSSDLPDVVLRYDARDDAVIDLHLPAPDPAADADPALVLLLHGGFWKQIWDRTHVRPMAKALAEAGFVVASPEYRRVGGGGGWPITGEDVLRASRVLPQFLGDLGIGTGRSIAVGHSAGGQLALWLATRQPHLDRVVALAPVADLREAARLCLGGDATQALMGELPYEAADPMSLFTDRPPARIHIVQGGLDDDVPPRISRGFVDRHPWITLEELPDAGHFDLITPGSLAWPQVLAAISAQ